MGYAATKKLNGFSAMGGEVPFLDPTHLVIVGLDRDLTPETWYAQCARLADVSDADLADYAQHLATTGTCDHVVHGVRDGDDVIVVDGRSTTRAARLAREIQAARGVPEDERVSVRVVLVAVVGGNYEAAYRVNIESHKARPLTRVQYARQVTTYYLRVGEDARKTATRFGIDPKHVANQVALMSLHESVLKAVDQGFPVAQAVQLAGQTKARQKEAIAELVAAGAVKGAAAANAVRKVKKGEVVGPADKTRMVSRAVVDEFVVAAESNEGFDKYAALVQVLFGVPGAHERLAQVEPDLVTLLRAAGWSPPGEKKAEKKAQAKIKKGGGEGGTGRGRKREAAPVVVVEEAEAAAEAAHSAAAESVESALSDADNDNDVARPPAPAPVKTAGKSPAPQSLLL